MSKAAGYLEFPCDVCGCDRAVEVPHVRDYTGGQVIHICKNCGFVYVKRRRPFARIAEVWSKELFGRKYTAKSPLMLARHHYVAEFLDQTIGLRGKRVVDIGAGEGQFLAIVRKDYGARVFGIEPSRANGGRMRRFHIPHFVGTLEAFVARDAGRRFDIATMMWTLENATSCRDMVAGARQILKDGGHLTVATGSRLLVPYAKPLGGYLSTNPVDTHPSRFSVNSLRSLLETSGFEVRAVNPYLNDGLALCVAAQKTARPRRPSITPDDYREVRRFFLRWHRDSSPAAGTAR